MYGGPLPTPVTYRPACAVVAALVHYGLLHVASTGGCRELERCTRGLFDMQRAGPPVWIKYLRASGCLCL
jgi:hypothetical protein